MFPAHHRFRTSSLLRRESHMIRRSTAAALAAVLACATAARAQTNVFSHAAGARVVAQSSNYGASWDVQNLVANYAGAASELPVWASEDDAPFPHWAVIDLGRATWLTTLVFNNALPEEPQYPGISAKDVEVQVSSQGPDAGFHRAAAFRLERNRNNQEVRIEPVQARWVKVVITSNWGYAGSTELGQLGGYDDGSRAVDLASTLRSKGSVDVYGLYFDFGSAALRPESAPVLDQIAALLKQDAAIRLSVEGHTDNVGDAASNQRLSQERAQAVVAALGTRGIPAARLSAVGRGATQPVADNATPVGRAKNRRVTLVVQH
jgi:outer membrane protein OmpA-like peptidoglycan-associated protein